MRTLNTFLLLGLLFVHSIYGQPLCSGCPSSNDLLKVATWNANLTPGSTQYPVERTVQAVRVINSDANADLLCLQEVYTMADQQGFIAGLNRTLPYSFTAPMASQNCSMSCTSENIATLNNCTSNCMTFSGEEGENCMYQHCGAEIGGLPVACQVCLGISTNQTLSASMAGCTATSGMATTEGCNYLHGGSSGNMILSKYPFTASRFITFNTTDNIAAGALHVRIDYKGTPINFFCTSLLPSSTPSSSGTDMTQLNQMQTTELMDWINSGVSNNEPVIVAGSLSQGPATSTGSEGMNSANYNMWSAAGYQSALLNLTQGTLPCTLCSSSQNSGFVTDHILVKMDSTPAPCISSAALFASRSTISTPSGSVPLSNHSGVTSSICYGTAQTSPMPTMSSSPVPTVMPSPSRAPTVSASPVVVPVVAEPVSEGGIAMPAVVLAAVLIGINVLANWLF